MMQEFVQALKESMQESLDNVHTTIPGEIISFDPAECTATVKLIGKFKKPDGAKVDYPPVSHVPVNFMQASGQETCLCFPIKPGDGCQVLFSEQSLEAWRTGGDSLLDLKHDLTNAIAIMGTCRQPNALMQKAAQEDAVFLHHKDTELKLAEDELYLRRREGQRIKLDGAGMEFRQGGTVFTLNDAGGTLLGNLEVKGRIHAEGDIGTAGDLSYQGTITGSKCP